MAFVKSVTFIALFVTSLVYSLCFFKNLRHKVDYINPIIGSFICSFASIIESPERRKEINLFVLPRAIETVYLLLKRRGLMFDLSNHGNIIFGIILGLTNYFY